jgi:hypothetical protein
MSLRFSRLEPLFCLPLVFTLAACGSSTSNDSGGTDASMDATNGGSNVDSGGMDAAGATDASDAAAPVDAAPVCPPTSANCMDCCNTNYPAGAQMFDTLTLQCACVASLCGPLDGGTDDAGSVDAGAVDAGSLDAGSEDAGSEDAAVYGVGACSAATCGQTEEPSTACYNCLSDTLGTLSNLGICGNALAGTCLTSAVCRPFLSCISQCPN